ncbi:MAG TPA: hypothetical protein PL124_03870 [Candidatus Cloacimonadota bacterium]|nr:hypothetical protein [Candidatus Cloacimonadota bacterium]
MYPPETQFVGNMLGKNLTGLHTSNLETSGIRTDTIIGVADTYQIDLLGDMQTYETESTPLLTLLSNIGSAPMNGPHHIWNDMYNGVEWFDIALDDLRLYSVQESGATAYSPLAQSLVGDTGSLTSGLAYKINNSAQLGGKLPVFALKNSASTVYEPTSADFTAGNSLEAETVNPFLNSLTTAGNLGLGKTWIIFKDISIRGNALVVWNRIRQLLEFAKYVKSAINGSADATTAQIYTYTSGTTLAPINIGLDCFRVLFGGFTEEKYSILCRIDKAVIRTLSNVNYVCLKLDFNAGASNCESDIPDWLGVGATPGAAILMREPIGSISRMAMIGTSNEAALPIPEGDNFVAGSNLGRAGERVENISQIFQTPSYGVTGTAMASNLRFDVFLETRKQWLEWYKKKMETTYLNGIKAETTVATNDNGHISGQPVRAMGGILDRALFPIRYMSATVPVTAGVGGTSFRDFLNRLVRATNAFKNRGAKELTYLCSQKFMNRLSDLTDDMMGLAANLGAPAGGFYRGGIVQRQEPNEINFQMSISTFKNSDGLQVKFIHDPALDYAASLNIPAYMNVDDIDGTTGHTYGARDILISLDMAHIKKLVLRPDKIEGNIQNRGQDAFYEGMRGESSIQLRFPRNHTIVLLTYATT